MDSNRKARFWRGPVLSRAHAQKIIRRLVITLGVIAALMTFTLIRGVDGSKIVAIVLFAGLALALHLTKSPIVAGAALILTAVVTVYGVVAGLAPMREGSISMAMFVVRTAWLLLPVACFRGFVATRALRKLPEDNLADTFS